MKKQNYTYYLTKFNDKESQFLDLTAKIIEHLNTDQDIYVNIEIGSLDSIKDGVDPHLQTR
jgi:hypothetical protein